MCLKKGGRPNVLILESDKNVQKLFTDQLRINCNQIEPLMAGTTSEAKIFLGEKGHQIDILVVCADIQVGRDGFSTKKEIIDFIKEAKNQFPDKIILGVPVAPSYSVDMIEVGCDFCCMEKSKLWRSIADYLT